MKQDALFVNTARGPIIVEEDLAEAAKAGKIRAILDVYEKEPLPAESPLRGMENAILIPHMGGPTVDRRPFVTAALMEEAPKALAGEASFLEISWETAQHMTH